MNKSLKLETNQYGYVKKIILDGEEIKVDSLCSSNEREHSPFLVYLNYVLTRAQKNNLPVINKELLRFGGKELKNLEDIKELKRRLGNALLLGREVLRFTKKITKFPYDKNYLLLSEVITLIFTHIEKILKKKNYEIFLKSHVSIFDVVEIKNEEDLFHKEKTIHNEIVERNLPFNKLRIKWFLGEEYKGKYYLVINDFITDLTEEKVKELIKNLDLKTVFNYYERPNFLLNLFKEFKWSKELFHNFDLPWFFTDFFLVKKSS